MAVNDTEIKQLVGQNIKKYRRKNNFTQFKLGELADINQRQIALIESGKSFPSLTTLIKFSNVFNCKISDFFDMEYTAPEQDLKESLKREIDKADYNDCKRLYAVIKSFMSI